MPTIAFAGVTEVPEEAWSIVERAIPAYGDDWWFTGLLAFVRQEQGRFDEAMDAVLRARWRSSPAPATRRTRGRTRTTRPATTWPGWPGWTAGCTGDGASIDSLSHFAWHAALHELSLGDLDAVRRRYDGQLRPEHGLGCRALVDTGSLLFRWALTPDAPRRARAWSRWPRWPAATCWSGPATPFLAMHSAVTLLALDDRAGLDRLAGWAAAHAHPTQREVVAPAGPGPGPAGRRPATARPPTPSPPWPCPSRRLGGSDAQREILEETRIAALVARRPARRGPRRCWTPAWTGGTRRATAGGASE